MKQHLFFIGILLCIGIPITAQITLEPHRVGINSDAPAATLEVNDTTNVTEVMIRNTNVSRLTLDAGSPNIQWNVSGNRKAFANWSNNALRIYSSPPTAPPFSFQVPTLNLTEERKVGINMGLVGNPTEVLDVNGRIKVGNSADTAVAAGTIRWNDAEQDFEGYDGVQWRSLTKNNASWGISRQIESELILADDNAPDARYGWSVSIDGDYIVVGALLDDDRAPGAGAAYILHLENGVWVEQAKLTASDADTFNYFGRSVAIAGDYVIVGAYGNNDFTGAAYIFQRSGSMWTEQARITASDGAIGNDFGRAVDIHGDYAIVGAYKNNAERGAAYIFQRFGVNWVQQSKLTASDGQGGDRLGYAVAISDGYAIAGAPLVDTLAGAAYVFQGSGSSWSEQAKLSDSDGTVLDRFGWSVDIQDDRALIGSPFFDDVTGSAVIFHRSGSSWLQSARLLSNNPRDYDAFGWSVALMYPYALVGAIEESNGADNSGASYIFRKEGTSWNQELKLAPSDPQESAQFGRSVSLSQQYALVGASSRDVFPFPDENTGAIYIYEKE